jgi:hypothetical protein
METGVEFIQRMREDAEFRQKVNACPNGAARLAFLKNEGYDFTAFTPILENLSVSQPSAGSLKQPGAGVNHGQADPGFWSRISQIFRPGKDPARTGSQPRGDRRGGASGSASF